MPRATKYTREILEPAVAEAVSMADVLRRLGVQWAGGTQNWITKRVRDLKIDTSHFVRVSNKGKKFPRKKPADILVKRDSGRSKAKDLRRAMLEIGIPHKCVDCGASEWMGKSLVLEIDHINGDFTDDRKENLRFLCPNCHSVTDTYGNKRRRSPIGRGI